MNRIFIIGIAARVIFSSGLPTRKNIDQHIKTIIDNFTFQEKSAKEVSEWVEIKLLSLFCAGQQRWRVDIAKMKQFMDAYNNVDSKKAITRFSLHLLLMIIVTHGNSGLDLWLKKSDGNKQHKKALAEALSVPSHFRLAKFAVTNLHESEWLNYIDLCKNLPIIPSKKQWEDSLQLRQQIDTKYSLNVSKRMMLEILWPLNEKERLNYSNRMDDLFKIVPTVQQLYQIHKKYYLKKMTAFLSACLTWQDTKKQNTVADVTTMNRLIEGLLVANHYIDDCYHIPDLCFSQRTSMENNSGIIIDGNTGISSNERLRNFISAMLIELQQTEYKFNKQELTIFPDNSKEVVLPKPKFAIDPTNTTGFVITNWSLNQLTEFFNATEFTDIWYKKPEEERNVFTISHEEELTKRKEKTNETTQAYSKNKMKLISQHLIITLINIKSPLKQKVWETIEHYANENQLVDALCRALDPIIKKEKDKIIPDDIKDSAAEKLAQNHESKSAQNQASTSAQNQASTSTQSQASNTHDSSLSVIISDTPPEQYYLKDILTRVDNYTVLYKEDLEFLENYRSLMTCTELTNIIVKVDSTVAQNTLDDWTNTFNNKQKTEITTNPLGLDFSNIDIDSYNSEFEDEDASNFNKFITDMESEKQNWIDDMIDETLTNNESNVEAIPSTSKQ